MKARALAAAVAASAGMGAFAAIASVPSGLAAGRPLGLVAEVARSGWFRGTFVVALALLLPVSLTVARRAAAGAATGAGDAAAKRRQAMLEPVLWGATAPLLSVVLDPWFFDTTVFVVGLAGVALGVLSGLGRDLGAPHTASRSRRRRLAPILAGAVLVPTFLALPGPPWFHPVSGDEPHYLVIARSLWVDGDVDVANEYEQGLWQPFWNGELSAHAKPGIDPAARYPIHGSGLGIWLAPWYGVGQGLTEEGFNVLVRVAMSLWLAAAAAALFFLLEDIAGARSAVTGTSLAVFTLPLLFAGPHLFPAVPAFALSCGAYVLLRRAPGAGKALLASVLLAPLPWLHFKFFGLMAAVAAAGVWWIWKRPDGRPKAMPVAALAAPLLLTSLAHVGFTWSLYHRLSPLAIHVGADPTLRATAAGDDWIAYVTDPVGAVVTGIGYFFDQREGLLFYAPQYLLAVAGFAWLWQRRRRDAVALALIFASLVVPYALSQEIGHWGPPARPLTAVLWILALPMGIALTLEPGAAAARTRAALRGVLVAAGACATVTMLLQADLLYHDYNVGRSLVLLRYGAPGLELSNIAPLWLGPDAVRWGPSIVWLVLAVIAGVFLWRWGSEAAQADVRPDGIAGVASPAGDIGAGASEIPASSPRQRRGAAARRAGIRAATVFVAVATAVLLLHHALVPVTALHEPWTFRGIRAWKPQSPPTRAWASEGGLWTGGYDSIHLLMSSREPLELIAFELSTLAPMQAEMQLGRDRQTLRLTPGQPSLARFAPGPSVEWNGEYFYHLDVVAHGGASRAALGIDEDTRGLGVFLSPVQLEAARAR